MEVITISSSKDDPDDPGVWIPAQSDAKVSESFWEWRRERSWWRRDGERGTPEGGLQSRSGWFPWPRGLIWRREWGSNRVGGRWILINLKLRSLGADTVSTYGSNEDHGTVREPKEVPDRLFSIVSDPLEYRR